MGKHPFVLSRWIAVRALRRYGTAYNLSAGAASRTVIAFACVVLSWLLATVLVLLGWRRAVDKVGGGGGSQSNRMYRYTPTLTATVCTGTHPHWQ
jgi:hypothetical protein